MPELLGPAGGPGTSEKEQPLWVDWSGNTAVWVCQCGQQGFGGLSVVDGRHAAQRHWSSFHPGMPSPEPSVTRNNCAWGSTVWGLARGEVCEKPEAVSGLCRSHYGKNANFGHKGMCAIEGCAVLAAQFQAICRTHATAWAREHGLDASKVRSGEIVWPTLPEPDPGAIARQIAAQAFLESLQAREDLDGNRNPKLPIELPTKKAHGTRNGYRAGCRCLPCGDAQSAYAAGARMRRLQRSAL